MICHKRTLTAIVYLHVCMQPLYLQICLPHMVDPAVFELAHVLFPLRQWSVCIVCERRESLKPFKADGKLVQHLT